MMIMIMMMTIMIMIIMIITFMIRSVFLSSIKIAGRGMTVAIDFFQVAEDGQSKKKYKNGLLQNIFGRQRIFSVFT